MSDSTTPKAFRIIAASVAAAVVLALAFFIGPHAIHTAYRATTPEATIRSRRDEYRRLDEAESGLSDADKAASRDARHKLFLWFHARGLNIDEGDENLPLWHPWAELLDYWRS